MEKIKVEEAVGRQLAYDFIIPGRFGAFFKKGHTIQMGDLKKLKDMGEYYVYVTGGVDKEVHESEAATRMAQALTGDNLEYSEPCGGMVVLTAKTFGLLKVNNRAVEEANLIDDIKLITKRNKTGVKTGEIVGIVGITPLTIEKEKMKRIERFLQSYKPILEVVPPKIKKIGAIITGTEIYEGRTKDEFGPALKKKIGGYGLTLSETAVLPDDEKKIRDKILEFKENGDELIIVTGGMSVDPNDVTPAAIRSSGARVVFQGLPAVPVSMHMLAYLDGIPILGVSGGTIYFEKTSFDLLLPRLLAKEEITRDEIAKLGHGGFLFCFEPGFKLRPHQK